MSESPPTPAVALRSIAHILDASAERRGWHRPAQLVRIDVLPRSPDEAVQFAVRELPPGVHPLAVLDGYVVEPASVGLGVVAEGRAFSLDDPPAQVPARPPGRARPPRRVRVRVVELATRDGTRVSGIRWRGGPFSVEEQSPDALVAGEITMAIYRALGVPVRDGRVQVLGGGI
jgi:hypothetical protein